jgi:hypothetical protein
MSLQALIKPLDEGDQAYAKRIGPQLQLDNVQSANTEFTLANEGLMFANEVGEVGLAHARLITSIAKLLQKLCVLAGMEGLDHRQSVSSADSL